MDDIERMLQQSNAQKVAETQQETNRLLAETNKLVGELIGQLKDATDALRDRSASGT